MSRQPDEHPLLGHPRRDVVTTAAVVAMAALVFLLVAVGTTRAAVQRVDDAFLRQMVAIRSSPLTAVAKVLNFMGSVAVTLPVRLAVAVYLGAKRRWWHLTAFASAMILSEGAISGLKALYGRARPPGSLVHTSGGSFPSGHAVAASVTALAIVIALFPEGRRRYLWGVGAVAFSLVMALSRAYLAAHWLSDAVAGTMLGASCALGAAAVVHLVQERREPGGRSSASSPGALSKSAGGS